MSADNWAICPRCVNEAIEAFAAERAQVMASYGQIPLEEFDAARAALARPEPEDFRTFREDYEFYGAESGIIHISYSGHYSKCDLGLDIEDRRKFWDQPTGQALTP